MSLNYWLVFAGGAALIVLAATFALLRERRRPSLRRAMNAVSGDAVRHVLLPDGMGGEIYIEHLLLTGQGLVVLDVKEYQGAIFGSDAMNEWTVIGKDRRFTFSNPQHTLYDRMAALRQLVRDVPVTGHVLFAPGADFSKGRPKDVVLANELEELYRKPGRDELERLAPHWQRVKEALRPAAPPPRRRL